MNFCLGGRGGVWGGNGRENFGLEGLGKQKIIYK
jgi:hypothetical protein